MKKIFLFLAVLFSFILLAQAQKPAYLIYDSQGNKIDYYQFIQKLQTADVVFFGELHNNPIAHWLELQVFKDLYKAKKGNIIAGAEMFEADNQLILDEYLSGLITTKKFEEDARLWPNYKTDYKPLIEFAKEKNVKFIATNIPRRYAGIVAQKGFKGLEALSDEAKKYIAPLPIKFDKNLNCYKKIIEGMPQMMHGGENIAKAQAIKDATMAYFIHKNMQKKYLFLHFNGAYHSDNHESIVWYLKNYNPNLKILTITTVLQKDITKLKKENQNLADFIIVVPEDMTTTY